MTIPFQREGFALPVTPALLTLLCQEVAQTPLDLNRSLIGEHECTEN